MTLLRSAVFCLFILPFFSCQKQQKQPEIHQIRFGSIDGSPAGNRQNKGFRFIHFMQVDLNTDSIFLKVNQTNLQEYEDGKKAAKYFSGKIPNVLKDEIERFQGYAFTKNSGPKFKYNNEEIVLYCGPLTFLEYRKDTLVRYFYIKHLKSDLLYDPLLGNLSENLYAFAINPSSLNLAKVNYNLDDDSIVAPIVNRRDFKASVPPPPVQKTIKFTPPPDTQR